MLRALIAAMVAGWAPALFAQDSQAEADALTATGVAGEIMDTAVEHCRRGERDKALAMFAAIRQQLEPPPAILRVIDSFEATGCDRQPFANGGSLRIQGGGGWDSNVSQGISARTLVLGSGDNLLELALDTSYRPRSSSFAQASVDYSVFLPGPSIGLQIAAGARKNFEASAFDLVTVSAAASREFEVGPGKLRTQLEVSQVMLGGRSYLRSESAAAQWLLPSPQGAWLATLSSTASQYVTQPSQNSRQWDFGILREERIGAAASVHAGFDLQSDDAASSRPGGDRRGWQAQLGAVVITNGWRFKPQLTYTRWNSAELFAPGLLDVPRRNRLTQGLVQAERPLTPDLSLVLEWRGRWATDTVALYKYQSQVSSATLSRRF